MKCKYESSRWRDCCRALSENAYGCTRPKGHRGLHMACGVGEHEHPIVSWGDLTSTKLLARKIFVFVGGFLGGLSAARANKRYARSFGKLCVCNTDMTMIEANLAAGQPTYEWLPGQPFCPECKCYFYREKEVRRG